MPFNKEGSVTPQLGGEGDGRDKTGLATVLGPQGFKDLFNEIKSNCESGGDRSQLSGNWDDMQRLCGKMVDGFTAEALQSYRGFLEAYEATREMKKDAQKGAQKNAKDAVARHADSMQSWASNLVLQAGKNLEFRSLVVASIINMAYKAAFENNDYYSAQALFLAFKDASVKRLVEHDVLPVLPKEILARYDKLSQCVYDLSSKSYEKELEDYPHAIQMPSKLLSQLDRAGEGDVTEERKQQIKKQIDDQVLKSVRSGLDKAAIVHKDKKSKVVSFLGSVVNFKLPQDKNKYDDQLYLISLKIKPREQQGGVFRDIFKEAKLSTLLNGSLIGELKERALAYSAIDTKDPGFSIYDGMPKQALAEALLTGDKEEVATILSNLKGRGFVEFTPIEGGKTPDENMIAAGLLQKMTEKKLPKNFGDVVINGNPERIAMVLQEGRINITLEQAVDIKQNYYRSKIASPLFREQIRATLVNVHINKQIDPTITVQARLHAFRSTTEYVISKVNEALADKDFTALAKYLPMLGFDKPQVNKLIELQNVELQRAYLAINKSIEQGVFNIKDMAGEAKKALSEALLNKDPAKGRDEVVRVLQEYNFVLLLPNLPSDKSERNILMGKVFDEVIPKRFTERMERVSDRKAAEVPLMDALLSGDKTRIVEALTSKFGMGTLVAEEMVPKLQRSLTARVLQERFSSIISPEVPIPVSQSKKQVVAEVSPPPTLEVAATIKPPKLPEPPPPDSVSHVAQPLSTPTVVPASTPADRFKKLQVDISGICGEKGDLSQLPEKWEEMQKVFGEIVDGFSSEALKSFVSLANDPTELFNTKLFDKKKKVMATGVAGQEGLVDVNGKDECPNVASLVRLQEGISFWARDLILENPNPSVCALSLASVINAAFQAAYVKHDYLTAMALYSALNLAQVDRLKKGVSALLPENIKQQYETLDELCSMEGHFVIYERVIKQVPGVVVPMPSQIMNEATLIMEANAPDEARKLMAAKVVGPLHDLMQKAPSERIPQTVDLAGVVSVDQKQLDEKSLKIVPRSSGTGAPPAKPRRIFDEAKLKAKPIILSKSDAFSMLPEWLSKILVNKTEQSQISYNDVQEVLKVVESPPSESLPSSKVFIKKLAKLGIKEEVAAEHIRFIKDRAYLGKIDSLVIRELLTSNHHVKGINPDHWRRGKTIKLIEKLNEAVKKGNYGVMLTVSKEFGIDLEKILTKEQFAAVRSKESHTKISDHVGPHSNMKLFLNLTDAKLKKHEDITSKDVEVLKDYVMSLEVFAKVNSDAEKLLKGMQELSGRVSPVKTEVSSPVLQRQKQVETVVITPQITPLATSAPPPSSGSPPVVKYPPLTKQYKSPIQLGVIKGMLEKACNSNQGLMSEVDHIVGQKIGKEGANGKPVPEKRRVEEMIKETSEDVKLSKAKQATPELVVQPPEGHTLK